MSSRSASSSGCVELGTRSVWVDGDLSRPAVPERLVAERRGSTSAGIDALVNNAGVTGRASRRSR